MAPCGHATGRASLAADLVSAGLDPSPLRQSSHGLIEVAGQLPPDETLLVVVDQFEELFRYKELRPITDDARQTRERQAADAAEFVQLLLEASRHHPPIYIVITMRSDYLGDCAEFRDLPETLNDCQYLVPRMTRLQRQQAIQGPLGRVQIAPSLVQRMLNDAGDEPDQLPVLQHALMRTWNRWRTADPKASRRIELQDYEAIGGFAGALNQHADELLADVREDLAACVFKRLTARSRSNRERRDPATLAELWAVCGAQTSEQQATVAALVDHFRSGHATFLRPLLGALTPDTYIDITHESLIRLWKKLHDEWLPQEQLAAKSLVDVAERATNWKHGTGEVLRGLDLIRIDEWDRARNKTAAWTRHYVDDVTGANVDEFVAASKRSQARRVLRNRLLYGAAIGTVLVAVGWGTFAEIQRRNEAQQDQLRQATDVVTASNDDLLQAQTSISVLQRALAEKSIDVNVPPPITTGGLPPIVKRPGASPEPTPPNSGRSSSGAAPPAPPPPVEDVKPRAYIQIRREEDPARLRRVTRALHDAGFIVPDPETLDVGPSATEVRYFRRDESGGADQIANAVARARVGSVRAVYVPGYENSERIRRNHYELWLAPQSLLTTLVGQLNDESADVRRAAGGRLARDNSSNPQAIGLVLGMLSPQNLESLSPSGLINGLYFLNRSNADVWTEQQRQLARDAIRQVRASKSAIGPQTAQELSELEARVSSNSKAKGS